MQAARPSRGAGRNHRLPSADNHNHIRFQRLTRLMLRSLLRKRRDSPADDQSCSAGLSSAISPWSAGEAGV